MKIKIASILVAFTLAFVSNSVFADSIVESYTCKLNEGKKTEELHKINGKWLKWIRANVSKDISSSVGIAVVGKQDMFLFVDTYPDLNTWAAAQTALDSDAAKELEDIFSDVSECTENRLWKFEPTK